MALDYLTKAQTANDSYAQKALELWSKKNSPSSLLNSAVCALITGDLRKSVEKYLQFLRHADSCSTFLPQMVPDIDSNELTKKSLLKIVLDQLMTVASESVLEQILADNNEHADYFEERKSGRINDYLNQMEVICGHYKYTLEDLDPDEWADYVTERLQPFIELARKMKSIDVNVVSNQHYLKFVDDTLEFIKFYPEKRKMLTENRLLTTC